MDEDARIKESDEKKLILFDMGLTGHRDLGVSDGRYWDEIWIGPFFRIIGIDVDAVVTQGITLSAARLKHLQYCAKEFKKDLAKIEQIGGY